MSELISHFGIDWKLLLAQLVNFAILLIVLKKFAYGPIVAMLRKRREEVAKGLEASKLSQMHLSRIEELKEETLRQAQGEGLKVVREAEQIAKKHKEEITAEAAKKGEALLAEAKRAIQEEKAKLREEIYKDTQDLVRLGIAGVLGKMAPKERDEGLIEEALRELRETSLRNTK